MNGSVSFGKGFAYRKDWFYVTASINELAEAEIDHSLVFRRKDGGWEWWTVDNHIVAVWCFDGPRGRTVMALSIDGAVEVSTGDEVVWEIVDDSDNGPSNLRHLTSMRIIGGHIYVAGMRRQVYRRAIDRGSWERADTGTFVPVDSSEIAGFKTIDGLHEGDIYAAGFYGEIWHWDGKIWVPLDSPTNVLLASLKCVSNDLVFVGGNKGIVLKGNKDHWTILENDATENTFSCIEYYQDTLYLATNQNALFKLDKNEIVPVDMGLEDNVSTRWLHANDGILLSVGSHDVVSFDGTTWTKIAPPQPNTAA